MNETCDRCGPTVGAAYAVARGDGRLYLCLPCGQRLWPGLSDRGWVFWPLGLITTAPQYTT